MMMTHDYKAALEFALRCIPDRYYGQDNSAHVQAIIQALRIADRVMSEPSDAMLKATFGVEDCVTSLFYAMRDQLLKEVEDDQ